MKQRFFINTRGKMEEKNKFLISTSTGVVGYVWAEDIDMIPCTISLRERAIPITLSGTL